MSALIVAAAALAYSGLASISVTLDRHYAQLHGRGAEPDSRTRQPNPTAEPDSRTRQPNPQPLSCIRLGLALSFLACMPARGWHLGPVLWYGVLTASALALTVLLHYVPHKAMRLAQFGHLAGPFLAVSWLLR